jgi:hypothetical protein
MSRLNVRNTRGLQRSPAAEATGANGPEVVFAHDDRITGSIPADDDSPARRTFGASRNDEDLRDLRRE